MRKTILVLGIAGLIFSGYISYQKFFSNICAFGESCPFFLGYPACYFGFAMYLVIAIFALLSVLKIMKEKLALKSILGVSFVGVLFSGYFSIDEVPLFLEKGFSYYTFGLPTCILGFIFFIAIFIISLISKKHAKN
jgi:uncharacterized membrane protein